MNNELIELSLVPCIGLLVGAGVESSLDFSSCSSMICRIAVYETTD